MEKTVVKAFRTLEVLAASPKPRGITELSAQLGIGKSNAHRILTTLTKLGYVKPVNRGQYAASLRLWEMGAQVLLRLDVKRVARPYIEQLAAKTGESVHLSVLDGCDVVYIDKIEGAHPVRAYSQIGERAPAYAVATGKALLAFQPDEVVQACARNAKAFTPRTITTARRLMDELANVRRGGFAINRGEWRATVCGVGAPIRDSEGRVVAALGISGPADRLKPRLLHKAAPVVINMARNVSREIGYRGA